MRRREFIALLRGVAIVSPLSAFAQQHAPLVQIRPVVVTPEEFRVAYPKVQAWIQKTLAAYEKDAQPIASMHFGRLPLYFDYDLLETAKFIPIDQVPMPPLSAMGLGRFAPFEQGDFHGVTYLDRYFIKQTVVTEEAVHFHELIHVIQWRLLGPEGFLRAYANGLDEFGYENSSLEKMAYDADRPVSIPQEKWEEAFAWPANNEPPYPPLAQRIMGGVISYVTVGLGIAGVLLLQLFTPFPVLTWLGDLIKMLVG